MSEAATPPGTTIPGPDQAIEVAWVRPLRNLAILCFLPLVVAWGGGIAEPWLSLIATPAAWIAAGPSALALPGLAIAVGLAGLAIVRPNPGAVGAARVLLWILGLAALAPLAALGRPLPWIFVGFLVAAWLREETRPVAPNSRWELATIPALWIVVARIQPFGDGLLPASTLDALALAFSDRPLLADAAAILVPLAIAPLVAGARSFAARRAAIGAVSALLLVATFGSDQAWLSAAVLGGVIGGWASSGSRGIRTLLVALLICGCASTRLALTERWRCGDSAEESAVTLLREGSDVRSLGLSAGNLAYLALIAEDGAVLQRMTATGTPGENAPLDPPGGFLVSPLAPGGPVVRVVPNPSGARLEWWDVPRLAIVATQEVDVGCRIEYALDDGENLVASCADRTVLVPQQGPSTELPIAGVPTEALNRGLLTLQTGPRARGRVTDTSGGEVASTRLSPFTADLGSSPGRFLVAGGPNGHLSMRAPPPAIPSLYSPPQDAAARVGDALRHSSDSVRVGVWPSGVRYSPKRRAAYVTSAVDASVTLVDVEVSWQQAAVSVGAPPRQVVLESGSARLYVANRCGVFAVRIPRPDPWE